MTKALRFLRLMDAHDGTLSLPVVTLYVGLIMLALGAGLTALGVVAVAMLALEHKRRFNVHHGSVPERLRAVEQLLDTTTGRVGELEPKVQHLVNRASFDRRG